MNHSATKAIIIGLVVLFVVSLGALAFRTIGRYVADEDARIVAQNQQIRTLLGK
jgi:hypothetical protein